MNQRNITDVNESDDIIQALRRAEGMLAEINASRLGKRDQTKFGNVIRQVEYAAARAEKMHKRIAGSVSDALNGFARPDADLGDSIHTKSGQLGLIVQIEPNAYLVKVPGDKRVQRVFKTDVKEVF